MDDRGTPLLISVAEAARRLSISRSKLYDLIARGEFPSVKMTDDLIRVEPDRIPEWIRKHRAS